MRGSAAMKIVHFADLHLDAAFASRGAAGDAARRRRQALRDVLRAIASLTLDEHADALFCGGDLYEREHATPDTAAFLRQTFASLDPTPVYIAPGNHDYYGRDSVYTTQEWSPNVHIFTEPRFEPVPIADGVTLWGAAHCAPANTPNFLEGFRTEGAGAHIALFHGSERSWFSEQGGGKEPHASFDVVDIDDAGLHHAFLGHYHRPKDASRHTYPGNPDPLEFGEDGKRGAVVATVNADGSVDRERRVVAITQVHDLPLDVTGCESQQQIRDRLAEQTEGLSGAARLTVKGDLSPELDFNEYILRDALGGSFDSVQIRISDLRPGYDLEAIRQEHHTVRGRFVNDVKGAGLEEQEERRILITGLRALDGRKDLGVL